MKPSSVLAIAGTLSLAATANCAEQASKTYLNLDFGISLQQTVNGKDNTGADIGKVEFDPGFRGDVVFGYKLSDSFAVELETGVLANSITSIAGNQLSDFGATADIYQIPLLVNVVYQIPLKCALKPYVGVGVGGAATILQGESVPLFGFTSNSSYSDVDFTFAYQAVAGFKYAINKNIDIGIAYKFIGTTEHQWSDAGVVFNADGTMAHTIVASFVWKF